MPKRTSWSYNILLFSVKLISLLPLWLFYFISDCIYLIGYYIVGYRKKIVTKNLRAAFPEKSEKEIVKIRKQFYLNFCDWLVESIKGHTIRTKNFLKRIKVVEGLEIIYDLHSQKKSIIGMGAHLFNWEWLCITPEYYPHGLQLASIYQEASHKEFTDLQNRLRGRYGSIAVPMSKTLQFIARDFQRGRMGIYYFFADQAPPETNPFWTIFLNQETSFFLGAEKIASKFDYGVVFLDVNKVRRGYYELSIKLITDCAKETEKYEITRAYVKLLEEHIQKDPTNWLWSHRRWKRSRPENIPLTPL